MKEFVRIKIMLKDTRTPTVVESITRFAKIAMTTFLL